MTVHETTPSPSDLTYEAAKEATSRDLVRMAHAHNLWWQIDPVSGRFYIGCDCDSRRRDPDKIEAHIKTAIRSVRGPAKR
jgi:hypothetical protein